jgi:MFS family permease
VKARGPLGIYNFAGDLGKAIIPAIVAVLLPFMHWRSVLILMALLGFTVGASLVTLVPKQPFAAAAESEQTARGKVRSGFGLLIAIGALDTATRMGYMLFLPFLIQGRGGTSTTIGLGLALLFAGGAFGKAACGWLGQHLGVTGSVIGTEVATAALIAATLFTPLAPLLVILPFLGIFLNGTSSVLYGTVPELAPEGDAGRAFAVFYSAVIGAGAFAPIIYGRIADQFSQTVGIVSSAGTALLIVPLVLGLRSALPKRVG